MCIDRRVGVDMRTNVVLDDKFVAHRERLDLRALKGVGELGAGYDYKAQKTKKPI